MWSLLALLRSSLQTIEFANDPIGVWLVVPFFNEVFFGLRRPWFVVPGGQAGAMDGHPPYGSIPGDEGQVVIMRDPKVEVCERIDDVVVCLRDQRGLR